MTTKHHWTGVDPAPDKFFGFCYQITNHANGRLYIGKKQYYSAAGRRKYRPSDITSDKWNDKHWKPSNWKKYTGSCKELNEDIKKYGKKSFSFEILSQHTSKSELHYAEIDYQVWLDVLRARIDEDTKLYYNKNIAGTKFIPPDYHSEDTVNKLKKILKERGHPLQGKAHPNKGKKLPQTAPKKHVSIDNVQITDGDVNLWWSKGLDIPEGFRVGITKSGYTNSEEADAARRETNKKNALAARDRYNKKPNKCNVCEKDIPYGDRLKKSCSLECRSKWRSKCSKRINAERKKKK